jgi:hypothetical protein
MTQRAGSLFTAVSHDAAAGGVSWSTRQSSGGPVAGGASAVGIDPRSHAGRLVVNADDWGRDSRTTGMIFDCVKRGTVSSVSAMVFMEDSERAATIALERGIDAGLHLNFTTPFSVVGCSAGLVGRQEKLASWLRGHRLASVLFHPGLARSFSYAVAAQLDEFYRLYGRYPTRIDGHHHMHLCANVLFAGLLPPDTLVRRNFSFQRGEKGIWNRTYRQFIDRVLARRHRTFDFLFSLAPLEPASRLERIFRLARQFTVEVETHPVQLEEYRFLADGEIFNWTGDIPIVPSSDVSRRECSPRRGEA